MIENEIYHYVNGFLKWNVCKETSYIAMHSKMHNKEYIKKDNKSHIFKHLDSTATCFDPYNSHCFKMIDKANSRFDSKIKEAFRINWRKSNLNAQKNHLALTFPP